MIFIYFSFSSVAQSCPTLSNPMDCCTPGSLSFIISLSLLRFTSLESMIPSNHFLLCRPLLLLPSIFPSIRVFSDESVLCIRWSKYWSFSFSMSPSNTQDWFPLGLTDLISSFKGLSTVFSNITVQKHQFFSAQISSQSNSHKFNLSSLQKCK